MKGTDYEAPHYVIFFTVTSSILGANILSAPFFRTPLIYIYSSFNVTDKASQEQIIAFKQTFYLCDCFRPEVS
jgi:hypothetical protein